MVAIAVVRVTDAVGQPTGTTITRITQDEPADGLGDGDKSPDGTGVGTATA